jgi:hypothetical protein
MERLETYRQLVQQVLAEHSQFQSSYGEIETLLFSNSTNCDCTPLSSTQSTGDRLQ